MARGWESKSVESQQEDVSRYRDPSTGVNPQQRADFERQRALELTRVRAAGDLSRATSEAHQRMLTQALEAIDAELAQLRAR